MLLLSHDFMILSDACFYIDTRSAASDNHFCFRPLACICCTATSWLFCILLLLTFHFLFLYFYQEDKDWISRYSLCSGDLNKVHSLLLSSLSCLHRTTYRNVTTTLLLALTLLPSLLSTIWKTKYFLLILANVIFCVTISAEHHYIFVWSNITDNPNLNTHTTWIYSVLINCESLPCESLPFLFLSLAMKGWDSQKQFSLSLSHSSCVFKWK